MLTTNERIMMPCHTSAAIVALASSIPQCCDCSAVACVDSSSQVLVMPKGVLQVQSVGSACLASRGLSLLCLLHVLKAVFIAVTTHKAREGCASSVEAMAVQCSADSFYMNPT